jgi:sarcosine oxidase subunit alpha
MAETACPKNLLPCTTGAGRGRGKAFVDLQMDVALGRCSPRSVWGSGGGSATSRRDGANKADVEPAALVAWRIDNSGEQAGTTVFAHPSRRSTLARFGRALGHLKLIRRMPMHDWHCANGADAFGATLLDRVYANGALRKPPVGRACYGVSCATTGS